MRPDGTAEGLSDGPIGGVGIAPTVEVRFDPFDAPIEATEELWRRLARPFDIAPTVDALLGLSPDVVDQLAGVLVATCDEAERLLTTMPQTLRNLRSSIGTNHERCIGELRGPVQWSETLAAQGSSLGNRDVYICAAPHRAYDIDENRVLVGALRAVVEAGHRAEIVGDDSYEDDGLRRARHNARVARRYLEHQNLNLVHLDGRPSRRALNRARGGKSNHVYQPAIEMLGRVTEPLTLDELAPYCDRRTRAQHALFVGIIEELERRGLRVPALRAESGSLFGGPVEFLHPRERGARSRLHGIIVGDLLVDVPDRVRDRDRRRAQLDLESRAQGRPAVAVVDREDVPVVVDRAIMAARGQ